MLRSLKIGEPGFDYVEKAFDWASTEPKKFMTIIEICRAGGFEPTAGDGVSVSAMLRRRGIQRVKFRGQRGALMPPLIVAKTTPPL
jgi:hypothetical protein